MSETQETTSDTPATLTSIDLFSGPGGLATGFHWAGIKTLIAVDWSYWTAQTYAASHNADVLVLNDYIKTPDILQQFLEPNDKPVMIQGDINLVSKDLLLKILNNRFNVDTVDIVTGGAPCESFSMAGDRKEVDDRNQLYKNILRVSRAVNAKIFVFENVKGLFSKKLDGKKGGMFEFICDDFESTLENQPDYRLASRSKDTILLKATNYGVPQARERLFLVGLNNAYPELEFHYPIATHGGEDNLPFVSVRDAISDLPIVKIGEEDNHYSFDISTIPEDTPQKHFLDRIHGELSYPPAEIKYKKETITSHKAPSHTKRMLQRIKLIKQGENMKTSSSRLIEEGKKILVEEYFPKKIYAARNRRLKFDEPSFTVTSHCLDEMIHPIEDRGLTPREAARLQSFPDWYIFLGPYMTFHSDPDQDQYEQIGDAIPPLLAYALAKEIIKTLS